MCERCNNFVGHVAAGTPRQYRPITQAEFDAAYDATHRTYIELRDDAEPLEGRAPVSTAEIELRMNWLHRQQRRKDRIVEGYNFLYEATEAGFATPAMWAAAAARNDDTATPPAPTPEPPAPPEEGGI